MKKIALAFGFWLLTILSYSGCAPAMDSASSISDTDNVYDSWAERPGFDPDEFYYKTWASAELEEPAWMYRLPDVLPQFTVPVVRCTDSEAATGACAQKQSTARCDRFWAWLMAQPDKETP